MTDTMEKHLQNGKTNFYCRLQNFETEEEMSHVIQKMGTKNAMHLEPKMMLSGAPYLGKDGDQGQVKETIVSISPQFLGTQQTPKNID